MKSQSQYIGASRKITHDVLIGPKEGTEKNAFSNNETRDAIG
jgi:hypothetical protein